MTYFVRFAGCNLRCVWCDSAYTFGKGRAVTFSSVQKSIQRTRAPFVCLTGGEPLLHIRDCLRLIRSFPRICFDIETGGSLDVRPVQTHNSCVIMDWKLKHSGMTRKMKNENLAYLRKDQDLLKFVTDGSPKEKKEILAITKKTEGDGFPISLQPVYGTPPQNLTEWMIRLKNPRLQINLQIHKFIWPLKTRGV
ncbi:MAG: radical SAM protein [Elusimicrobia bacterium]|nr:radical SAM protein [Elusimicrobiota bacterium]